MHINDGIKISKCIILLKRANVHGNLADNWMLLHMVALRGRNTNTMVLNTTREVSC